MTACPACGHNPDNPALWRNLCVGDQTELWATDKLPGGWWQVKATGNRAIGLASANGLILRWMTEGQRPILFEREGQLRLEWASGRMVVHVRRSVDAAVSAAETAAGLDDDARDAQYELENGGY